MGTERSHRRSDGPVCVLEADFTGHRLHYLHHLVEAAGRDGCVVLSTTDALRSAEYETFGAALVGAPVVLTGARSRRELLGAAVAHARACGARSLVVPEGDFYLWPALLLVLRHPRLPLRIRLLLMRTQFVGGPERLRPAMVVKPLLAQLLRLFGQVRVLFLTDALGVVRRRRGYPGIGPVRDPVVPEPEHHRERPPWFPPQDRDLALVGALGVISARKNLPLLVAAVAPLADTALVVAGRLEPDVREFVDTDPLARTLLAEGRLVVCDRLLDAKEFDAALAAVDVVAVLHDNDAPSGILAEACVRRTPVLVPQGGWLARVVETTGIGTAAPPTADGVAAGIRRLVRDVEARTAAMRRQDSTIGRTDFTARLLG